MLRQHKANVEPLVELLQDKNFQRIAGFGSSEYRRLYLLSLYSHVLFISGCFAAYSPKVFKDYQDTLRALHERDPSLQFIFPRSIFPACTFNLGPQAISAFHFDAKNKPNGPIVVTPLGNFDRTKGGHIVFKTLKLIVEFPAGSSALFLSSVIEHANTPIGPNETRMSFTQYAAGGLFRWVANKFQTKESLKKNDPITFARNRQKEKTAWKESLDRLSTIDSLAEDQRSLST